MVRLGKIVATRGALDALRENADDALRYFRRHASGDWGDVDEADKQANDRAARIGGRLLSAYHLQDRRKVWVVTEADHSVTTLLLPSEY